MPRYRCARCGEWNYAANPDMLLTARQLAILDAVADLCRRSPRRTASTAAIAAHVGWSVRTVRYELSFLEQAGELARPAGQKSGWAARIIPVVGMEQLAAS